MKRIHTHYLILLLPLAFTACLYGEDTQADLLPVTVRRQQALDSLTKKLVSHPYGWTTVYQANEGVVQEGTLFKAIKERTPYPLLLKFFENNTVAIWSQLELSPQQMKDLKTIANPYKKKDMFKNDTIDWRLELRQQVSLVFENYGIFHYLLSIVRNDPVKGLAAFMSGADVEFGYERTANDTIHFIGLSDVVSLNKSSGTTALDASPSVFWLVPAKKNSIDQFK